MHGRRLIFVGAGLLACASAPARDPEPAQAPPPPVIVEPSPSEDASPPGDAAPTPSSTGASTGIPECDAYLALYKRCATYLEPQIMAGERRPYHAEEASLVYYAGTPEAATMGGSCKSMLEQLEQDCPEQHRSP